MASSKGHTSKTASSTVQYCRHRAYLLSSSSACSTDLVRERSLPFPWTDLAWTWLPLPTFGRSRFRNDEARIRKVTDIEIAETSKDKEKNTM